MQRPCQRPGAVKRGRPGRRRERVPRYRAALVTSLSRRLSDARERPLAVEHTGSFQWKRQAGPPDTPRPRAVTTQKGKGPMSKVLAGVQRFLREEGGPTAVEYAVMLALIIVVCISALPALGSNANNTFSFCPIFGIVIAPS